MLIVKYTIMDLLLAVLTEDVPPAYAVAQSRWQSDASQATPGLPEVAGNTLQTCPDTTDEARACR